MQLNQIIQGDCLDVMREIPDKYFDLCLTDPPYGIGASKNLRANTQHGKSLTRCKDYGVKNWDRNIPSKEYYKQIFRVSKNQIIFGGNYFVEHLTNSSCWLVWDKDNGINQYADCELIFTSFPSAVRKYKFKWHGMLQENMDNKEIRFHPTQKPVELLSKILKDYSKEGMTIIDPFAGSCSTAIACKRMGRQFLMIEQDAEYCEIGRKRLAKEYSMFENL